jgi:hypothetical protein
MQVRILEIYLPNMFWCFLVLTAVHFVIIICIPNDGPDGMKHVGK